MFIAISPFKVLGNVDLDHYIDISSHIDLLLLRTPMGRDDLWLSINYLLSRGFPRDKLMVHTDTSLVEDFDLKFIHFKENDENAFIYKAQHPHVSVSMSTHSVETIMDAKVHGLDFVFFGHVFESASKLGRKPRSFSEIERAVGIDIPVFAIGGIDGDALKVLPKGFKGICAISFFRDHGVSEIEALRKVWNMYV